MTIQVNVPYLWELRKYTSMRLSCDTPFKHGENVCVYRPSWAKPRFIFQTKVNGCITFWFGIFLFKNKNTCVKKLKQRVATQLKVSIYNSLWTAFRYKSECNEQLICIYILCMFFSSWMLYYNCYSCISIYQVYLCNKILNVSCLPLFYF